MSFSPIKALTPYRSLNAAMKRDFRRSFSSKGNQSNKGELEFVSRLKTPIVNQLWMARGAAKANAEEQGNYLDVHSPRTPAQSETKVSYPFSSDEFLKETYKNPWGQIRFGKILEDLDALAGNIAFAHVRDPHTIIVTASVDKIQLQDMPSVQVDQHLSGKVSYVGTSSMEIQMHCVDDTGNEWMKAYFTFVATDPETHRPQKICPLVPESPKEIEAFQDAAHRAEMKKKARKTQRNCESYDPEVERVATKLLAEAGPLLNMPSLANPNTILVRRTQLQSVSLAQPQFRNTANQIFGGFLMRKACELAWSTAYAFGGARPIFYEVDQVQFSIPVNVGDLINFTSRVLYCSTKKEIKGFSRLQFKETIPLVSVEVEAWIVDPAHTNATMSNRFYFTFALRDKEAVDIRRVLPSSMEEARTMATRMAADKADQLEFD
eukprot:Nitzschia sp. Nitz4//scaffold337_size18511//15760//17064//NITZ4_008784-RA/size18511-processed-gene-0.4-mRNA-1//1//CDS//3329548322//9258//frame0